VVGPSGVGVSPDDAVLVGRLREGDESAFDEAIAALYAPMLGVARGYVRSRSLAEEVVQEAWVSMLEGLDRFEGRSTLRTWGMRIVANIARDRAVREARTIPFSAFEADGDERSVEPERFNRVDEPYPDGWRSFPRDWRTLPETRLLGRETLDVVARAIAELPESQRVVVTLRDVHGFRSDEVCEVLDISPGNQRVLLHRARARIRNRLERHFDG
jgi:RNA polymerase sigma-70 factor (ECF subfamily)